ncbi:META domain-containing protein [Roseinatronobacter bogoriensis]|uniref:META domain-containing protein n=1 Tax=Roseinatronobacter bogoriensis TaxID=119542 RepID=UPI0010630288|nr:MULTISPECIES: META domain-containing protein [Rhodobaca]MBB4206869.1 heat shock protein HslJ [Rhodobaca bogoriensis DSM 18756]TDW41612.1 heat shock protein HslJ [Rhodobaca barguzinensis]TDY74209.1 heat shock protein HslJ [Rhodobaca bogoriensis DSM 18756]
MPRWISAFVCLVLPVFAVSASASETRVVSGQVTVLERMALPDDTVLLVDLVDAMDTAIAASREVTEGRQSPFSFALEAPVDTDLVLRVGLRGPEDVIWLSEPVAIEAGADPADLGALRAMRIPPMGFAGLLYCGNQLVEIGFMPESVRIRLNEQIITLLPQVAASGALFADADNPATTIHMRDASAVLRIDGSELSECRLIRPEQDITQGVWSISAIEDRPTLFPSRTELVFYPDGRMSASVGCNRLIGGYRRHGGILSFGRLASTRLACPEGLGEQEQHFNTVLPRVDQFFLDAEAGRLTLYAAGTPVLRARR